MSEIEKMYENAGVEPKYKDYRTKNGKTYEDKNPNNRNIRLLYPPFTPDKQLELVKWLCKNTYRNYLMIRYNFTNYYWQIECNMVDSNKMDKFSECIASIINNIWQDLTEQERTEIADILRG